MTIIGQHPDTFVKADYIRGLLKLLLKQRIDYLHPENVEKVFEEYSIKLDMIYDHP